jgi:ABC-type uncharacterized transport system involved in gliding motility auxiliary subunit
MSAVGWLKQREGARLAVGGLVLAAILYVCINLIAEVGLRGAQADMTDGQLYSLAAGTRTTLATLEEPVELRLYFSRSLADAVPPYAAYYERVKELLNRYVELANGKLTLTLLDPQPFSDAEDRAVADGLQGVPVTQAGDLGYFGIAGSNTTDGHETIGFLNLQRERFLEYDVTKLVQALGRGARPVLGVMSALPPQMPQMPGMPPSPTPQLSLLAQLDDFFTVETLAPDAVAIPESVKVLLVINLDGLAAPALRAIDTFVHTGRPVLVLLDPVLESLPPHGPMATEPAPPGEAGRLLAAWGLRLVDGKVAGDLDAARRVSTGGTTVADYPVWLTLPRSAVDEADPLMASVQRLHLASAGILEKLPDATTTIAPLIRTGPRSAAIDAARVRFGPDVVEIIRNFKASGERLMLAARVSGEAKPAFPGEGAAVAAAPVNLIVVSDVDFIYDRFWLNQSDFFGEQVVMPIANNADFVINALENLAGSGSLAGLRGRGSSYRPFTLVEQIRLDAEQQYRAKEEALQGQLRELQQRLEQIERRQGDQGQISLTAEDEAAIANFRSEILGVRKQLRDVQLALRQDIEVVETRTKFINIGTVPLVIALIAIVLLVTRRTRRRRAVLKPA